MGQRLSFQRSCLKIKQQKINKSKVKCISAIILLIYSQHFRNIINESKFKLMLQLKWPKIVIIVNASLKSPPPPQKKDKIKSDANRYISDRKWRYHDYSSRRHAPFPRGRGNAFHRLNSPPIGRFSGFSHSNGPWLAAAGRSPKKRLLLALCQLSSRTRPVLGIGDRLLLSRITESANRVRRQKIPQMRGRQAVELLTNR